MTQQADEDVKHQFSSEEQRHQAFQLIQTVCEHKQVSVKALRSGSRIRDVSRVRSCLSEKLVSDYERGRRSLSAVMAKRFAKVLKVREDRLMYKSTTIPPAGWLGVRGFKGL